MLPKPEKVRKGRSQESEQLDLVETLSQDKNLSSKRRLVFVIMTLTIFLPLVFMLYRQFSLSPKKSISTPEVSFPVISQDFIDWSFYVGGASQNNQNLIWSKNPDQIGSPDQISKLLAFTQKTPLLTSGPVFDLLPKGFDLHQYNPQSDVTCLYVNIPQNPFFMIIKSPPESSELIPVLVDRLYWGFTGRF
ncbi:MAG: hypothetical protein WCV93_00140 [Candidatus Shapirobacteria bacterium]|jgi:hypothetical protein